jgi:hypothetical protein
LPADDVSYPVVVTGMPVVIYSARVNTGLGSINIKPVLTGTSTIALQVESGP